MAVKHIVTVYGTGRPAEYASAWAEFVLKEDLPLGTLVAIDDATGKLVKADQTKVPVGVVHLVNPINVNDKLYLDGERDAVTLKAGSPVPLYKQFLISGLDVKGTLKIGSPVYLTGADAGAELTCTKPATGFIVGTVERVADKLVRFDLTFAGALKLTASKID